MEIALRTRRASTQEMEGAPAVGKAAPARGGGGGGGSGGGLSSIWSNPHLLYLLQLKGGFFPGQNGPPGGKRQGKQETLRECLNTEGQCIQ